MNYINEDNDTDSGRVKGSNKDRVISFFYRYRYRIKLKRTFHFADVSRYSINHSLRLRHRVVNKISSLKTLDEKGIKYIEVDPSKEVFDFDKYDYYYIHSARGKGIATTDIKQNKINSGLSKMSSIKAKGLERRIDDSTDLVNDTRKKLNQVRVNVEYPVLKREDLSKMYKSIRENINDLKYEYEILKGETNNRSYALENAIKIIDSIDTYSTDNIAKMDDMLKVASLELNKLSVNSNIKKEQTKIEEQSNNKVSLEKDTVGINLYDNKLGYNEEINKDKQTKQSYVDEVVKNKVEVKEKTDEPVAIVKMPKEDILNKKKLLELQLDIVEVKTYEEKITYELNRQKEIIDTMYKKVGLVTKEEIKSYQVTGYGKMLASLGNIALGMVTLPLSKLHLFNMQLGANLINKGIKNLQKGLDKKEIININYKYEDFTSSIDNVEDSLEKTNYLINDSLGDLEKLKISFIKEFSHFKYQIPDYDKTLKNIDILSKRLKDNQEKLKLLNNDLSVEKEKNKIMLKKINNQEY